MTADGRRRLLIIGPLPPPYAGPEIGTEMFVKSPILQAAFAVDCINTTVRAVNSDKGKADLTMVLAYVRYTYRLLRAMLVFRPDVILYRPTSATLKGWVRDGTTLLIGSSLGSKVALQFGGGHFRFFYDSLGSAARSLISSLLKRSAIVLAESRRLCRQFEGLVPESRIGVLPTAISNEFFDNFEGLERSQDGFGPNVLFVGHLTQAKGYCDVLKVIPDLAKQRGVRFRFVGVRQGTERNIFFNQATGERISPEDPAECFSRFIVSNRLEGSVDFLGDRVFGAEKLRVFEAATVFVLPSYSEGFSRAILEGMAAGLPLVVSRVGAVPDFFENGVDAFIVDPGDVPALRDRIELLLSDPVLRTRMGQASRERCRSMFLGECVSAQLVEILKTL